MKTDREPSLAGVFFGGGAMLARQRDPALQFDAIIRREHRKAATQAASSRRQFIRVFDPRVDNEGLPETIDALIGARMLRDNPDKFYAILRVAAFLRERMAKGETPWTKGPEEYNKKNT